MALIKISLLCTALCAFPIAAEESSSHTTDPTPLLQERPEPLKIKPKLYSDSANADDANLAGSPPPMPPHELCPDKRNDKHHEKNRYVSPAGPTTDVDSRPFEWNAPHNNGSQVQNTIAPTGGGAVDFAFFHIRNIQPKQSLFFDSNIGIGFLYFSRIKGNLMVNPSSLDANSGFLTNAPLKGRLTYNRTPLYEYIVGGRFLPWFKAGLSYQYQGGVVVQTPLLDTGGIRPQLTTNLSLNGLLLKAYFESPIPFIWGPVAMSIYANTGVGVGWQSWTGQQLCLSSFGLQGNFRGDTLYFANTSNASAIWTVGVGLRFQKVAPYKPFSLSLGIKYNQWGQARNIGEFTKQGNTKIGLFKPVTIRNVYQWSPYLGVEWNFTPTWRPSTPYKVNGQRVDSVKPFAGYITQIEKKNTIFTQFNGGLGLLFFNRVMGLVRDDIQHDQSFIKNYGKLSNKLKYNKSPLFEYLIGFRATPWFRPSLSYQYQTGINIQTRRIVSSPSNGSYYQFISGLNLSSVSFKAFFELPKLMIWRSTATSFYGAVGFGASWQSWTRMTLLLSQLPTAPLTPYQGFQIPLSPKISSNIAVNGDIGTRIQSAYPNSPYAITLGCKFNYWGQAKNLGLRSQQGSLKFANQLFKIKAVYQFAPYLGFQWSFSPNCASPIPYKLQNNAVNSWIPFLVNTNYLKRRNWNWVQFNAGIGFLYFSNVRANLMIESPGQAQNNDGHVTTPFKHGLTYNKTPLFEYLVGATLFPCLKLALSYQHQGSVVVQTDVLSGYGSPTALTRNPRSRFISNLSLDALMFKCYLESPWALVWKALSFSPYLAMGVGPSWQSWTNPGIVYTVELQTAVSNVALRNFKQEISANCAWMGEFGINTRSAMPNSAFSIWTGAKYNQWGQARNIGAVKKHGSYPYGMFKPFSIKTVYQWAPYIGVQWNF